MENAGGSFDFSLAQLAADAAESIRKLDGLKEGRTELPNWQNFFLCEEEILAFAIDRDKDMGAVLAPLVCGFYLNRGYSWKILFILLGLSALGNLLFTSAAVGFEPQESGNRTEGKAEASGNWILSGVLFLSFIMSRAVRFRPADQPGTLVIIAVEIAQAFGIGIGIGKDQLAVLQEKFLIGRSAFSGSRPQGRFNESGSVGCIIKPVSAFRGNLLIRIQTVLNFIEIRTDGLNIYISLFGGNSIGVRNIRFRRSRIR